MGTILRWNANEHIAQLMSFLVDRRTKCRFKVLINIAMNERMTRKLLFKLPRVFKFNAIQFLVCVKILKLNFLIQPAKLNPPTICFSQFNELEMNFVIMWEMCLQHEATSNYLWKMAYSRISCILNSLNKKITLLKNTSTGADDSIFHIFIFMMVYASP